jgi:hypothetical protein
MLHHCLQTRQTYDPDMAFAHIPAPANDVAC